MAMAVSGPRGAVVVLLLPVRAGVDAGGQLAVLRAGGAVADADAAVAALALAGGGGLAGREGPAHGGGAGRGLLLLAHGSSPVVGLNNTQTNIPTKQRP